MRTPQHVLLLALLLAVLPSLALAGALPLPRPARPTSDLRPAVRETTVSRCADWVAVYAAYWNKFPQCHQGAATPQCCELYDLMDRAIRIFQTQLQCVVTGLDIFRDRYKAFCTAAGGSPGTDDTPPTPASPGSPGTPVPGTGPVGGHGDEDGIIILPDGTTQINDGPNTTSGGPGTATSAPTTTTTTYQFTTTFIDSGGGGGASQPSGSHGSQCSSDASASCACCTCCCTTCRSGSSGSGSTSCGSSCNCSVMYCPNCGCGTPVTQPPATTTAHCQTVGGCGGGGHVSTHPPATSHCQTSGNCGGGGATHPPTTTHCQTSDGCGGGNGGDGSSGGGGTTTSNGSPVPTQGSSGVEKVTFTSGTCFAAAARVIMSDGVSRRMDALRVGDVVHVSATRTSPIFLFTHARALVAARFVHLHASGGAALTATPGHFVHAGRGVMRAGDVRVGDVLLAHNGTFVPVVAVSEKVLAGLYNPQTMHGDIVVDGFVTTTYTETVVPVAAHTLLVPVRAAMRLGDGKWGQKWGRWISETVFAVDALK